MHSPLKSVAKPNTHQVHTSTATRYNRTKQSVPARTTRTGEHCQSAIAAAGLHCIMQRERQELTISPVARHSTEDDQSNNDALRQGVDGLISLSDFPHRRCRHRVRGGSCRSAKAGEWRERWRCEAVCRGREGAEGEAEYVERPWPAHGQPPPRSLRGAMHFASDKHKPHTPYSCADRMQVG